MGGPLRVAFVPQVEMGGPLRVAFVPQVEMGGPLRVAVRGTETIFLPQHTYMGVSGPLRVAVQGGSLGD